MWQRLGAKYGFSLWESRFGVADESNPAFREWATDLLEVDPHAVAKALNHLPSYLPNQIEFMRLVKSFCPPEPEKQETAAERQQREAMQAQLSSRIQQEREHVAKLIDKSMREEIVRKLRQRWSTTDWSCSAVSDWLVEQEQLENSKSNISNEEATQ
ncbi:hypothetical protein [Pleionea sediminis]|uniref:hypothetical protein n=1 Tax=Pleionea sediminis TaxID=2569479 RepID=UPI001186C718|nr:hypothetical protein [Pleionea sediminis]